MLCLIIHQPYFSGGLQVVNLKTAKKLKAKSINVTPGFKVCPACNIKLYNIDEIEDELTIDNEDICEIETDITIDSERCSLNYTLSEINVSPFKTRAIAAHSLITHGKKKLQQCLESFSEKQIDIRDKVATVLDIESRQLEINYDNESPDKLLERKADDLDRLLNLIKEKMLISNRPEKIKLLTLLPLSWKQKDILDFFPVTKYMITESKNLLQEKRNPC